MDDNKINIPHEPLPDAEFYEDRPVDGAGIVLAIVLSLPFWVLVAWFLYAHWK